MKINIILSVLIILTVSPMAHAVSPAPDGGYPGFNTAEGQNALFSRTTGVWNTAVGAFSLYSDATANGNTAIGINTLRHNVNGQSNTAVGLNALFFNDAEDNSAFGSYALFANTSGTVNSALGWNALVSNTQGSGNTGIGVQALLRNTIGIGNTATGRSALSFSTGDLNTAIGYAAGSNIATASNVICIGAQVAGADVNDSCFIGNIWSQPGGPQAVYVNIDGKLGAQVSSRRFKDNVEPMGKSSEGLYSLKPVTFRYKKEVDPKAISQCGLIAEDVEEVNPDLVLHDKEGKPYSVRYDQVNAMLLNEFLKEHRKVQNLEATVAKQTKEMATLANQLNEQAAQMRRVSLQVQMTTLSSQIVGNGN